MEAKRAMMTEQTREQSLLDNFATTAQEINLSLMLILILA